MTAWETFGLMCALWLLCVFYVHTHDQVKDLQERVAIVESVCREVKP